ncbi:MAG: hypothetical protein A2017_20000 [Lentisphaerae bacterium GWF2_44_16]|nr:MAG: hypothetical protein A2017_20000 [Lentisphaerae bacterium GWF2_44_16]
MTVSRALRNHTPVREVTRKRIIRMAEKLGYNHAIKTGRPARAMNGAARPAVELVLGVSGRNIAMFYSELIGSVERELSRNGYDCIVRTYDGEYSDFLGLRDTLRKSPSQGLIITGSFMPEQLKALIDVAPNSILLDNTGDIPASSLSFDNVEAARMAMKHLLETGRKKIVLLKGLQEHYFSKEIEQGYRDILNDSGIGIKKEYILNADFTSNGAFEVLNSALERGLEFDAVFTNDEMACGVYRALNGRSLKIPDDVAVCGCDGLPVGEQIMPSLSTVFLDYRELGRMAVENILNAHASRHPCRIKLLPELRIRESTIKNK